MSRTITISGDDPMLKVSDDECKLIAVNNISTIEDSDTDLEHDLKKLLLKHTGSLDEFDFILHEIQQSTPQSFDGKPVKAGDTVYYCLNKLGKRYVEYIVERIDAVNGTIVAKSMYETRVDTSRMFTVERPEDSFSIIGEDIMDAFYLNSKKTPVEIVCTYFDNTGDSIMGHDCRNCMSSSCLRSADASFCIANFVNDIINRVLEVSKNENKEE